MSKVNLDALIPREDFEVDGGAEAQNLGDKLKVSELVKGQGFFYSSLRKPDFQRETSDWDKNKIASFVKSFVEGDLIPSIILWQAGQYIFVIDGAHRLSALIAWVNDDYGDGFISQSFFNHPKISIVSGGATRIQSVFNAASKIDGEDSKAVLIHDAVRPWLELTHLADLLNEFHSSSDWDGIYPCIASSDSLREKKDNQFIPVDRASFFQVQTPQIFNTLAIQDALSQAINSGEEFTDETQAMEHANYKVKVVEGNRLNNKVTFADDLRIPEIDDSRIGRGIDFHRLEPGNGMTLAGIFLESNLSIVAHSDGDIVLHALSLIHI